MADLSCRLDAGASVSDPLTDDVLSSVLARILADVESLRGRDFISRIAPLLAEVIKADYRSPRA